MWWAGCGTMQCNATHCNALKSCNAIHLQDGMLCGELAVARAIGDYHLRELKRAHEVPGTLSECLGLGLQGLGFQGLRYRLLGLTLEALRM